MSITNSLYIGISGLAAHGDAISVVGDNIANASTVGFKRSRASFSDLLGGELASQRLGGGVRLGRSQTMWDQGSITQTSNPLDVALDGGGMFVVKGGRGGREGQFYTRDGRFQLDNKGMVVDPRGLRLQGFAIDSAGQRAVSAGDLALGGRTSPPIPTTKATLALNLDSTAAVKPAFTLADPQGSSNYARSINVTDSTGAERHVDVYFRSAGTTPPSWEVHAVVDGADVEGGTPGTPVEIGTGTLTFDTDGKLVSQDLNITADFKGATAGQAIAVDFGDDTTNGGTGLSGTTSFARQSAIASVDVDGRQAGSLNDIVIGEDGTIEGIFDNGDRFALARIALADFASLEGLEREGDGLMSQTAASGQPLIDVAGTGRRGALVSGALEASNVDLGTELVTLIAYQRAFQANAKTVTTADEMMADVNNLKR
jgi:flagellar hook protein FlgE